MQIVISSDEYPELGVYGQVQEMVFCENKMMVLCSFMYLTPAWSDKELRAFAGGTAGLVEKFLQGLDTGRSFPSRLPVFLYCMGAGEREIFVARSRLLRTQDSPVFEAFFRRYDGDVYDLPEKLPGDFALSFDDYIRGQPEDGTLHISDFFKEKPEWERVALTRYLETEAETISILRKTLQK